MVLADLNYKKIILAILVILIGLALLIGVIWLLFLSPSNQVNKTKPEVTVSPGGSLPQASQLNGQVNLVQPGGRLTPEKSDLQKQYERQRKLSPAKIANGALTQVNSLLNNPVKDIEITGKGFIFLDKTDNKFYYLSANGRKILLDQEAFKFVDKVTWAKDGNKVVLQYPDGSNIFYDLNNKKKVSLPKGAEDFSFDKSSNKLAYKYISSDPEDNWLVVNDIKTNNARAIEPLGKNANKVEVNWSPTEQVVALYREPTGLDSEEVYFLGLHGENFLSLKVKGSNFKGIWSPDGQKILYHAIPADETYNPTLWIADGAGDNIGRHNFSLGLKTWVDKCAFGPDSKTVYCAVPVNLPVGSGLYPDLVDKSEDVFYKIDLRTGLSSLIAYPILSDKLDKFQVKKLFVSQDGSKLYFWDKWTNRVYYLLLK